jgi:hypothetical protein
VALDQDRRDFAAKLGQNGDGAIADLKENLFFLNASYSF